MTLLLLHYSAIYLKRPRQYLKNLFAAENDTDAFIEELMKTQKAQNDPQRVLEEMEKERREMEEMFTIKADEVEKLREKDVLSKLLLLGVFSFP